MLISSPQLLHPGGRVTALCLWMMHGLTTSVSICVKGGGVLACLIGDEVFLSESMTTNL